MARITGHGTSGANSAGGPRRPEASSGLKKLGKKTDGFSRSFLEESTGNTAAYLRKTSGMGLPMADEEPSSPGEVRSTAKDIGKKALSVLTTKGFSKHTKKLSCQEPYMP